jgi:myosin heavy subunit
MGILDEECVFPKGTDQSFVEKLHKTCVSHPFYESNPKEKSTFTISHYAGKVTYQSAGFLDKNKDTLFNSLKEMLESSSSKFVCQLFPPENVNDSKRPPTSVSQFKSQVLALVDTLMSCTPHYIRCIRPNTTKQAKTYDLTLCTNQVKYLGLLENVKVRRAGFAYRQSYERFLHRFDFLVLLIL